MMVRIAVLAAMALLEYGQETPRLLDREKAQTNYSFPIRPGGSPFRFRVELDQTMTITGVSVFRSPETSPFQTLPMCTGISEQLYPDDERRELLEHADLNFDGFEDLEILQYYQTHLGTKVFCVYTWDNRAGRFRQAPEIPAPNPIPHPENRTITTHQDWMGGIYADSVYQWTGARFVLMESSGRALNIGDTLCHFSDVCEKRVHGKMVITLYRPVMCADSDGPDPPLECPTGTKPDPNAPKPVR